MECEKNRILLFIKPEFANNETAILEIEKRLKHPRRECEKLGIKKRPRYKIVSHKFANYTKDLAEEHYAHLKEKPFFGELVDYMTSGSVLGIIVEGDDNTVEILREIVGATKNPREGTIRHDIPEILGWEENVTKNVIHCSDSYESAEKEIELFEEALRIENGENYENS